MTGVEDVLAPRVVHVFQQPSHIVAGGSNVVVVMVLEPHYDPNLFTVFRRLAKTIDRSLPDDLVRLPGSWRAAKQPYDRHA